MDSATGESSTSAQICLRFSLAEIQSATNNFDGELLIGHGGFGKVYKGCLCINETSHVVAVKRLDSTSNQGAPEFRAEIEILSKLRHSHLVSLIGFCDDHREMILVYEYMPNGTLYDHLHKARTPLSWVQRVKIAMDAARGLDYLHTGTLSGIIHRDVKSANILLDENWKAKISDFGLSKVGPTSQSISYVDASVRGTFGYLDPEYFCTRKLTMKTDVYAFGVVLFEVLSGRFAVDERNREEQYSLVRWAQKCVKERKLDQMVDSNIKGTISSTCLRRFTQIADRCVHSVPRERPTMTEVVASLQALLELQESPGIMGFPWKIQKYFVPSNEPNFKIRKLFIMGINMLNSFSARVFSDQSATSNTNQHEELETIGVKLFTYDELKLATRDFGNETFLGEGRYGKAYKGWVDNTELPIVVKKLCHRTHLDLEVMKNFVHPNFVKLIGYCLEGEQLFLVYEFMHKGNLEKLLQSGAVARLPLVTKVEIVVEIARGVVFLQDTLSNITWPRVSESPLYRHKILLDENFTPKLSGYDITLLVDGKYSIAYPDFDGMGLVLESNLSGYEVVFMEVLTGEQIHNSNRPYQIDLLFRQCGKVSLRHIAQFCFEICNEVDSKYKMLRMLKEHDELIQRRLKSWLLDPPN